MMSMGHCIRWLTHPLPQVVLTASKCELDLARPAKRVQHKAWGVSPRIHNCGIVETATRAAEEVPLPCRPFHGAPSPFSRIFLGLTPRLYA